MEERQVGSSGVLREYVTGPGIDQHVQMRDSTGNESYYVSSDVGSVGVLTGATGTPLESYEYTWLGRPLIRQAYVPDLLEASPRGNPFLFQGARWEPETGLYDFRNRHYDPAWGEFVSIDPLGIWAHGMGNGYEAFGGDGWNNTDPWGLERSDLRIRFDAIVRAFAGLPPFSAPMNGSFGFKADGSHWRAPDVPAPRPSLVELAAAKVDSLFWLGPWRAEELRSMPVEVQAALQAEGLVAASDLAAVIGLGELGVAAMGDPVLSLPRFGKQGKVCPPGSEGTRVFRVFGENNRPLGESWTTVDPRTVENFRDAAGLPDVNTGRFVIEGRLVDTTGVTTRRSLPLDGNRGGLHEVLIPDAQRQVIIDRVSGVNPEY